MSAERRHLHFVEMFHGKSPDGHEDIASSPIIIEDDAWIGFGSAIFKGVTVGKGAVVAAMSVVTKDVAPYTVVAGNPARQIGVSRQ
jgi:acetyltransferase-like isoleucine patch superfamily enzyme